MKNYVKLTALCLLLTACLRGENNSVEQVLNTQRTHFSSVSKTVSLGDAAKNSMNNLSAALEKLSETDDSGAVSAMSESIATDLFGLITKSGFTSRPALTELMNQYRVLSVTKDTVNFAAVKLLTARTYSALAAELETTKFAL